MLEEHTGTEYIFKMAVCYFNDSIALRTKEQYVAFPFMHIEGFVSYSVSVKMRGPVYVCVVF